MVWTKPVITDISIACGEDVLQNCWSASEPGALEGQCQIIGTASCPSV